MTDQWVLSIIAKPPDTFTLSSDNASDGSDAIGAIFDSLSSAAASSGPPSYRMAVARAAYVRDIGAALHDFKDTNKIDPDIIQIIGHGSSGRLELGAYWTREADDRVLGPAVLDSNPNSYGMLCDYIKTKSRVFLLGCQVGSSAPSGYVASGRALLFDIEDMTGANVYAADDLVYPKLFENGIYRGSLVTSTGKPANPAVLPFVPDAPGATLPRALPIPRLQGVLSAPALGFEPKLPTQGSSIIKYLNDYVVAWPQPTGLLAMSEIELAGANLRRVEAICGLRYVRVQDNAGKTTYYEHASAGGPDAGRVPSPVPALNDLRLEYRTKLAHTAPMVAGRRQ